MRSKFGDNEPQDVSYHGNAFLRLMGPGRQRGDGGVGCGLNPPTPDFKLYQAPAPAQSARAAIKIIAKCL